MSLKGNKGEWSEFYAFVKLLSTGRLYAADEDLNRKEDIYFPIQKILRTEGEGLSKEYIISSEDGSFEVHWNAEVVRCLPQTKLVDIATYIFRSIEAGRGRTFEINDSDKIMHELDCSRITAPSTDKADITMQLHDIQTGYDAIYGFSIKSKLGSPPTLLNASQATNFVFEVVGLNDIQFGEINAINTRKKIMDRMSRIKEWGSLNYRNTINSNFKNNLMMLDTCMDEIIASILLDYYEYNESRCSTLVERLESRNPLDYPRRGMYEYKFKKFLCAVALGMQPADAWGGHDEATGGYVIVKSDVDVLAYHIYNRDAFESYLLNNTRLDHGSTERHDYAKIYNGDGGKMYINLNLQIRFL